jgi:hypothetical protein
VSKFDVGIEERRLHEVVEQYLSEGWTVDLEPSLENLPGALHGRRVDFLARRAGEVVVGEIASRGTAREEQIDVLARQVKLIPNARLEVHWLGDSPAAEPEFGEVQRYISEARAISDISPQAAFLMGQAALEGAVAAFAERVGVEGRKPARQLLANLYSLGFIDESDFTRYSRLWKLRSAIAHQATAMKPQPEDVEFILNLSERMRTGRYVSADAMVEWFTERYEDATNRLPHPTLEGDYQHNGDGFSRAEDLLRENFPYATEEAINDAVMSLGSGSHMWAHIKRRNEIAMLIYRGARPRPDIDGHIYGETGEGDHSPNQRWADAHWWRIAAARRPKIRLLIIVVKGVVRRMWQVLPAEAWEEDASGKVALPLGDRPLTSDEVEQYYPALGIAVGDHRPARPGLMREYVPVDGR